MAAGAPYRPWRFAGWECRDAGVAAATDGLAGVRVARPAASAPAADAAPIAHATEFSQLVVLRGEVTFEADGHPPQRLTDGSAAAIPGGLRYRLSAPTAECELLDVTLPAAFDPIA